MPGLWVHGQSSKLGIGSQRLTKIPSWNFLIIASRPHASKACVQGIDDRYIGARLVAGEQGEHGDGVQFVCS
eukprot:1149364-Pelagomonas_calceolata.AAC.10